MGDTYGFRVEREGKGEVDVLVVRHNVLRLAFYCDTRPLRVRCPTEISLSDVAATLILNEEVAVLHMHKLLQLVHHHIYKTLWCQHRSPVALLVGRHQSLHDLLEHVGVVGVVSMYTAPLSPSSSP